MKLDLFKIKYFQEFSKFDHLLESIDYNIDGSSYGEDALFVAKIILAMILENGREKETIFLTRRKTRNIMDISSEFFLNPPMGKNTINFIEIYGEFDYKSVIHHSNSNWVEIDGIPRAFNAHGKYVVLSRKGASNNYSLVYGHKDGFNKSVANIVSALPSLFPNIFEQKKLEDWEYQMLKTFSTNLGECFDIIDQNFSRIFGNAKERFLRLAVEKMTKCSNLREIESIKQQIEHNREEIKAHTRRINQYFYDTEKLERRLFSLEYIQSDDEKGSELIDFLSSNKCLSDIELVESPYDDLISMSINTEVAYYDEEALEIILNSRNFEGRDVVKEFLTETLLNKRASIMMSSSVDISGNDIRAKSIEPDAGIANPHLAGYNCFGGNLSQIHEALRVGDYVTAISIAIASTANINFYDSTVMSYFYRNINNLYRSDVKVVRYDDGSTATIMEFLEKIRNEKENEIGS